MVVELYLKQVSFYALPFSTFKLTTPLHFFVSRVDTLELLERKIRRSLMAHLYNVVKDKSTNPSKFHLWNCECTDVEKMVKDLNYKYKNYTHASIKGTPLNINQRYNTTKFEDLNICEENLLIVELAKPNGEYVFRPAPAGSEESKTGSDDEGSDDEFTQV